MKTMMILAAAALSSCAPPQMPQERRENMQRECVARGGNAIDCANATIMVIPEGTK